MYQHHVLGSGHWLAETAGRAVIYGGVYRVMRGLPLLAVFGLVGVVVLALWLYSRRVRSS